MKVLVVGGPRQGEWAEVSANARTWVDLLSGTTHRIAYITWAVEGPLAGSAAELWRLPVAVHPMLRSAGAKAEQEMTLLVLHEHIARLHMNDFMREHAIKQEMADPVIEVPDTAAELEGGGS